MHVHVLYTRLFEHDEKLQENGRHFHTGAGWGCRLPTEVSTRARGPDESKRKGWGRLWKNPPNW